MRSLLKKVLIVGLGVTLLCGCTGGANQGSKKGQSKGAGEGTEKVAIDKEYIASLQEQGYITVGCKSDVPDMGYYDSEKKEWSGLEVELAYKTAAKLFNVSESKAKEKDMVHFKKVTVADREKLLEEGEVDLLLATYTITHERKERFAFSDSYFTDYIGFLVKKTTKDNDSLGNKQGISTIKDLDGKYVGVPKNATTRDAFIHYIESMDNEAIDPIFCEMTSYDQLKKALMDGNISAMAVDTTILKGYMDNQTELLNDRFGGQNYGAATTKEHRELLDYVNQAIDK